MSVDKLQQISIIEFCVWVPPKKTRTTPSTSLKMHGGETSRIDTPGCDMIIFVITSLLLRSMHYPPETASIMLMARMVAVVKQVRLFEKPFGWFAVKCILTCADPAKRNATKYPRQDTKTRCWLSCRCLKSNFMVFNVAWNELPNVTCLVWNRCQTPCHAVTVCGAVLICSIYCQTYTILRRKACVITDASAPGVWRWRLILLSLRTTDWPRFCSLTADFTLAV